MQNKDGVEPIDGNIKYLMGLMEDVKVTSYGIQNEHTFIVVNFEQISTYEGILRQPFMQQMVVVHDWGYNNL